MDLRTILAAALGVGLGLVLVAAPDTVIRVHTAGRRPTGRHGEYGTDGEFPAKWRRLVQAIGVAVVGLGLLFTYQLLS